MKCLWWAAYLRLECSLLPQPAAAFLCPQLVPWSKLQWFYINKGELSTQFYPCILDTKKKPCSKATLKSLKFWHDTWTICHLCRRSFILEVISNDWRALRSAPQHFRCDVEVLVAAATQTLEALELLGWFGCWKPVASCGLSHSGTWKVSHWEWGWLSTVRELTFVRCLSLLNLLFAWSNTYGGPRELLSIYKSFPRVLGSGED